MTCITSYAYDALHRISSITIAGINTQTFTYDDFDRVTQVTETVGAKSFTTKTEYDALGREWKHGYPSGYYTVNQYDANGYLTSVKDPGGVTIWEPLEENAKGQLKRENRGGRETSFDYDSHGLPMSIKSTGIIDLEYIFDSKGNLQSRKDIHNVNNKMMDSMAYDNLNRLTSWNVYANGTLVKTNSQTYDPTTGNIASRTDLDNNTMYYGLRGRPHSLDSINGVPANFPLSNLSVTYTDFNKINTLNEGNKLYTLTYGIDDQRRKSVYAVNGVTKQTRYYLGDYEEEVDATGNIRKIHYLSAGAVLISNNGQDSLLFGYADYQGSLIALTDKNGTVLERYAYDPWGQRRDTSNWALSDTRTRWLLNRGYTGHEHLDAFGIINMNGRVYDPLTAQFFSPDPFVQAPGNWLNYNRYGYCYNNPLSYIDPDGEWIHIVIGAAIGGVINLGIKVYQGKINSFGDGIAAFGIGALAGAVGAATGGVAFAAAGGAAGGAGGFLAGAAGGIVGSATSMPIQSFGNSTFFGDQPLTGKQYLMGITIGGLVGGTINGGVALGNDRTFLNGTLRPPSTTLNGTLPTPSTTPTPKPYNSNYQETTEIQIPDEVSHYTDQDPSSWKTIGKLDANLNKPTYFTDNPEMARLNANIDLSLDKVPNFRIDCVGEALDPNKIMLMRTVTGNVNGSGGGGWEILYNGYIDKSAVIRIVRLP